MKRKEFIDLDQLNNSPTHQAKYVDNILNVRVQAFKGYPDKGLISQQHIWSIRQLKLGLELEKT